MIGKRSVNGLEAVAWGALDSGVQFVSGYPGGPVTSVLSEISTARSPDIHVEWSVNEKEAFAGAYGAALLGRRSLAVMKHVGINVASDAIMNAAFTGIRGGLVGVTGADPGGLVSQHEMDDRFYAPLFMLPMLEPATPQQAYEMVGYAFELSERHGIVVLIRMASAFLTYRDMVEPRKQSRSELGGKPARFVPKPENACLGLYILQASRGRHERFSAACEELAGSGFNAALGSARASCGIITSGPTARKVDEAARSLSMPIAVLRLGIVYPFFRKAVLNFMESFDTILLVEEIEPWLEEKLRDLHARVLGKMSGDLPREGSLSVEDVKIALERVTGRKTPLRPFDQRASEHINTSKTLRWADNCPIRSGHMAFRKALDKLNDPLCIGGVGVVSWGAREPFFNLYGTCCMGISPSVVGGMYHAAANHGRLISVMGDSSFLHSGVQSLMNAVYSGARLTLIIFDNGKTAETGGQPNPGTGVRIDGGEAQRVSLPKLIAACGVKHLFQVDAYDETASTKAICDAADIDDVSVVLLKGDCPSGCCGSAEKGEG